MSEKDISSVHRSHKWRESKQLILLTATTGFFLNFMLTASLVPIIPPFLEGVLYPYSTPPNQTKDNWNYNGSVNTTSNYERKTNSANDVEVNRNGEVLQFLNETQTNRTLDKNGGNLQSSVQFGILIGSTPSTQIFVNPIVGIMTHKIGYIRPMIFGSVVLYCSTVLFAFGQTFEVLLLAGMIQGVALSCTAVAGLGALCSRYDDQVERDNAIRLVVGGTAFGVLIGSPFGGVMYQYFGKTLPMLIISVLALINTALQLLSKQPIKNHKLQEEVKSSSTWALMKDPYIILAAATMFIMSLQMGLHGGCSTIWMLNELKFKSSEVGIAFVPTLIGIFIISNIFGRYCLKMGRWLMAIVGMIVFAVSFFTLPFTKRFTQLVLPNLGVGMATGILQTAIIPEFAYLVDIRHTAMYGKVFAINDLALNLGSAVGFNCSGVILKYISFTWIMMSMSLISIAFAPFIYLLKNPPVRNKNLAIAEDRAAEKFIGTECSKANK